MTDYHTTYKARRHCGLPWATQQATRGACATAAAAACRPCRQRRLPFPRLQGPEGETTQWDDIQVKLGNKAPKVGRF